MNGDHLIQMANQIGVFFESMPEHDAAVEGIATHIRKFWDPRMRRAFLLIADDAATQTQLSDIVQQAVRRHRALLA